MMLTTVLLLAAGASGVDGAAVVLPEPIAAAERILEPVLPAALDGRLRFAYLLARHDPVRRGEKHWLLGRSVTAQGIAVTVRLNHEVDEASASRLRRTGCEVDRLESGVPANVGPIVAAECTWEGLFRTAALSDVLRIAPTFDHQPPRPATLPPKNTINRETGTAQASEARYPLNGRGAGVIVADFDSGADPTHPFLFRADGGAFKWIDVNQSGAFEPGIDAVDFNRNGAVDPGERLRVLKASTYWYYEVRGSTTSYNLEPEFVPGLDWLYMDENNDGLRNRSDDSKPTFGEQLFVVDDVNGDGKLALNERVIALKTPKIRAIATENSAGARIVYRRDTNLSHFVDTPRDLHHGTMVTGTIAGGSPEYERFSGLAPDADLIVVDHSTTRNLVTALAWAKAEGAQIALWEMSTWYIDPLDGSSDLQLACDAASEAGMLQIGAAGNLGGSAKHRVAVIPTGTSQSLSLVVPSSFTRYFVVTMLWKAAQIDLSISVSVNGVTVPLTGGQGQAPAGAGTSTAWAMSTSPRGTQELDLYVYNSATYLTGQTVTFTVTNAGTDATLHGYVTDGTSSWGPGVYWGGTQGVTDEGTYGTPAVSDKTLAVGTYYLDYVPRGLDAGVVAYYSGQGPRIDGLDSIDVVAPEDHVTALSTPMSPFGSMWVGAGTSNATPAVVGAAAVIRGLNPDWTPAQVTAALRANTRVEPRMGTLPNNRWGYGKLGTFGAAFDGGALRENQAPTAAGRAIRQHDGGMTFDATGSQDPDGDSLRYRWDLEYDGTFDVGPTADVLTFGPSEKVTDVVKLEAIDALGRASAALITVEDAPPDPVVFERIDSTAGLPRAASGCGCGAAPSAVLALAAIGFIKRSRRTRRCAD